MALVVDRVVVGTGVALVVTVVDREAWCTAVQALRGLLLVFITRTPKGTPQGDGEVLIWGGS